MDLETMAGKVEYSDEDAADSDQRYFTQAELYADFQLIVENAFQFNPPGEVRDNVLAINRVWVAEWTKPPTLDSKDKRSLLALCVGVDPALTDIAG